MPLQGRDSIDVAAAASVIVCGEDAAVVAPTGGEGELTGLDPAEGLNEDDAAGGDELV